MSPSQWAIDNYANSIREIAVILTAYLIAKKKQRRERRARKVWVRSYMTECPTHGHYECLMCVLFRDDPELYRNFLRMNETISLICGTDTTPLGKAVHFLEKASWCGISVSSNSTFPCIGLLLLKYGFWLPYRSKHDIHDILGAAPIRPTDHTSVLTGRSVVVQWGSLQIKYVQYGSTVFNSDRLHTIRIDCVSIAAPLRLDCRCSAVAASCTFSTVPCRLLRIVTDHGVLWMMDIRFITDTYPQWNITLNRVCVTLVFGEVIIQNLRNSAGDPPVILGMSGQSLPTLPCTSLLLCNGWNKRVIHMLNYNYLVVLNIWRPRIHLNRCMNAYIVSVYEFEEGKEEICGGRCDVTHPTYCCGVCGMTRLGLCGVMGSGTG